MKGEGGGEGGSVQLVRVKLETLADPAHRQTTLEPREGLFGLFGWNTVSKDAKQVRECHYTILNAFFRL